MKIKKILIILITASVFRLNFIISMNNDSINNKSNSIKASQKKLLSNAIPLIDIQKIIADYYGNYHAELRPPIGHNDHVRGLAYSKCGHYLASSSDDGTVKIWETTTNNLIMGFSLPNGNTVESLAFSPDFTKASSGRPSYEKACDLPITTFACALRDIPDTSSGMSSFANCKDSEDRQPYIYLACGKRLGIIHILNILKDNNKCIAKFDCNNKGHTKNVNFLTYSPNGQYLASTSHDKTIKIWDMTLKKCLQTIYHENKTSSENINSLAFSPDGNLLISGGVDCSIKIWLFKQNLCLLTIDKNNNGHTESISSLSYSPNGQYLASGSYDQTIKIWDLSEIEFLINYEQNKMEPNFNDLPSKMKANCLHTLAYSDQTDNNNSENNGHTDVVNAIAFSPNGQYLASGSSDRTIKIWSFNNFKCIHTFENIHNYYNKDKSSISNSMPCIIPLVRTSKRQCYDTVITTLAYCPSGEFIAFGSFNGVIVILKDSHYLLVDQVNRN